MRRFPQCVLLLGYVFRVAHLRPATRPVHLPQLHLIVLGLDERLRDSVRRRSVQPLRRRVWIVLVARRKLETALSTVMTAPKGPTRMQREIVSLLVEPAAAIYLCSLTPITPFEPTRSGSSMSAVGMNRCSTRLRIWKLIR